MNPSPTLTYEAATGRLLSQTDVVDMEPDDYTQTDLYRYDASGNTTVATQARGLYMPAYFADRITYYGSNERIRAVEARGFSRASFDPATLIDAVVAFDEFRYDALGRRVWARTRRRCADEMNGDSQTGESEACALSTVVCTVWDGEQTLYEIRMPGADNTPVEVMENDTAVVARNAFWYSDDPFWDSGRSFGRVAYVHGGGIDKPLAVVRMNYTDSKNQGGEVVGQAVWGPVTILPLWSSRGQADRGSFGGGFRHACLSSDTTNTGRCMGIVYTADYFPYARSGTAAFAWHGSLLEDKADATGTLDRRNRAYDPATGRFALGGGARAAGRSRGGWHHQGDETPGREP
ncbi:MAG: hypothetical protein ACRENI_05480 [Gemmatimonadaceae bacterium]